MDYLVNSNRSKAGHRNAFVVQDFQFKLAQAFFVCYGKYNNDMHRNYILNTSTTRMF